MMFFAMKEVAVGMDYKQNLIKYADGVLYVYHYGEVPSVTVSFNPGLKIEGQLLTTTNRSDLNSITAEFIPVQNNDPITLGIYGTNNFQVLMVSVREGEGRIKVVDGSEIKEFQALPVPKAEIKLPWPELYLLSNYKGSGLPWKIETSGNVVFSSLGVRNIEKRISDGKAVQVETFVISTSDESKWLNGKAVLTAEFPYIGYSFPFRSASAFQWLGRIGSTSSVRVVPEPSQKEEVSIEALCVIVLIVFIAIILMKC